MPERPAVCHRCLICATSCLALPGSVRKLLGFSRRRPLPRWRADTFWRSHQPALFASGQDTLAAARAGDKAAVLFVDTFNGTFEKENALAAARVLKAAGYVVHTLAARADIVGCGRTFLSVAWSKRRNPKPAPLIAELLPFASAESPSSGWSPRAC